MYLNKEARALIHVFGEGYFITDEYDREVNTFVQEKEFDRLIEKFKYRQLLIEKLNKELKDSFDYGEDNLLLINGKRVIKRYWSIPKNEVEVDLYFKIISKEFNSEVDSK
ncbi:hypothetical protein N9C25_00190 [Saprospiraceae bacterium]|nr:hypothetical protein [Saprospiraceae bacterium]